MAERERLGALLESYDAALAELYGWRDSSVADLIIRLEVWRTAAQLELLFLDSPPHTDARAGGLAVG
jgi:hypothetical protein